MTQLDFSPLLKAIARLQEGLDRYEQDRSDLQIRDGLIQRFEFTYEQCHKMLKRYLKRASASPEVFDTMPFQDLIRSACAQGLLLGDWTQWKTHREMRAKSSYTHDEPVACEVVQAIPGFLREARYLSDQLQARS